MQRINTSSSVPTLFGAGKPGFQDGNPATATPATYFDASWCNAVQEELAEAIEAFGVTLEPGIFNQLATILLAINTAVTNAANAAASAQSAVVASLNYILGYGQSVSAVSISSGTVYSNTSATKPILYMMQSGSAAVTLNIYGTATYNMASNIWMWTTIILLPGESFEVSAGSILNAFKMS